MSALSYVSRRIPGSLDLWRQAMEFNVSLSKTIWDRDGQQRDGVDLFNTEFETAALASLFADEHDAMARALVAASAAAHAGSIAQTQWKGTVELRRDGKAHRFPAGGLAMTPGVWAQAWGAALAVRDPTALAALTDPRVTESVAGRGDLFWMPTMKAIAAVQPGAATGLLDSALHTISLTEAEIVEPGYVDHLVKPLLELGGAICRLDQHAFTASLEIALRLHSQWYGSTEREHDTSGFLAIGILGLAALAHDAGMQVLVESAYLPAQLIPPNPTSATDQVLYHYPARRLRRSEEANWFLDLEGFPRSERRHVVVERQGRLIACYTMRGAPGISSATFDAELPQPNDPDESSDQDALDVGELILAADLLSQRAGNMALQLSERRAWLEEAIECAEEASTRIASCSGGPEATVFTERGRAAFRAEPSRFATDRLDALVGAWRTRIHDWDEQTQGRSRTSALSSIAVLRAQLEPALMALRVDNTEKVARLFRPSPADFERVFVRRVVTLAMAEYEKLWAAPLDMKSASSQQSQLTCYLAPAGMLGDQNELSWRFPVGYQSIARFLNPERVWAAWKYVVPGSTSGLSYDGLVWCDDHWVWFPKPYRVLRALA